MEVPSFLLDDQGVKGKGADLLFLFLPRKELFVEGACRTWDAWSLLTLKEIGWGPPTMQAEKYGAPNSMETNRFVSYRDRDRSK